MKNYKLYLLLERVWATGRDCGLFTTFNDWVNQPGREDWLLEKLKEALSEDESRDN